MNSEQKERLDLHLAKVRAGMFTFPEPNDEEYLTALINHVIGEESKHENLTDEDILIKCKFSIIGRLNVKSWTYMIDVKDYLFKQEYFIYATGGKGNRQKEGERILNIVISELIRENMIEKDGSKFRIKNN